MIVAVGVFGVVVFLLFRGHAAGPQEAAASGVPPISSPAETTAEASPLRWRWRRRSDDAATSGQQETPAGASRPAADRCDKPAKPGDRCGRCRGGQAGALAAGATHCRPGDKLNKLLQAPRSTPEQRQTIKDEMAKLSKDWLFGPAAFPGDMLCDTYTVKSRRSSWISSAGG